MEQYFVIDYNNRNGIDFFLDASQKKIVSRQDKEKLHAVLTRIL